MIRVNARIVARSCSALAVSAVLASGAGCAPVYSEPAAGPGYVQTAPPPPVAEAPPVVVESPPAQVDAEVIYEPQPPVVDIESYPSVMYEGAPVYYVGGRWYRHGPRGWAYYRQEPVDLGRQRVAHEREPRWVQARDVPLRGAERVAPQPPRPGVAEPQGSEHRETIAPQERHETTVPGATPLREETKAPVVPPNKGPTKPQPKKRAPAPVKRAPLHPEPTPKEPER